MCVAKITGKSYVIRNAKKLLDANHSKLPCWFTIVFPAMLEQAEKVGLHVNLPHELKPLVSSHTGNRYLQNPIRDVKGLNRIGYHSTRLGV